MCMLLVARRMRDSLQRSRRKVGGIRCPRSCRLRLVATLCTVIVTCALGLCLLPRSASADTLSDLQARVEASTLALNETTAKLEQAQREVDEGQKRIDELNAHLQDARAKFSKSLSVSYKMQQDSMGLLDLLVSSNSLEDVIEYVQYSNAISYRSEREISELLETSKELAAAQSDLEARRDDATQARQDAENALNEAEAARTAEQNAYMARQAALAEQERAALEEAARAGTDATFQTENGNDSPVRTPTSGAVPAIFGVNWNMGREEFISHWAARIDAFLSGFPLAGYGRTFAEAAYDRGVDPRLSPAISNVESTRGTYCFLPHNAWGWGQVSWPDWDTAIRAHIAGLAAGYAPYLTVATAKKYCPPNAAYWYATVLWGIEHI